MGARHRTPHRGPSNDGGLDLLAVVLDAARAHELLTRVSGHLRGALDSHIEDWTRAQLHRALRDVERAAATLRQVLTTMDD